MRTILAFFAAVIAFGSALKVAEPLASWSYDTILEPIVCQKLDEHAAEFSDAQAAKVVINEVGQIDADVLDSLFKRIDVDLNEVSRQIGSAKSRDALTSRQISAGIVKPAAMVALKPICLLLCFVLLWVVFHAIVMAISHAAKLPVLHKADKWLGGALGFLKGLVIVYLLAMLLGLIGQITEKPQVKQTVEHSRIVTTCQQIKFNTNSDQNKTE